MKDIFDCDEDFAIWAFGPEFKQIEGSLNFMKAWNERHGEDFMLIPEGHMQTDEVAMKELYRKTGKKT